MRELQKKVITFEAWVENDIDNEELANFMLRFLDERIYQQYCHGDNHLPRAPHSSVFRYFHVMDAEEYIREVQSEKKPLIRFRKPARLVILAVIAAALGYLSVAFILLELKPWNWTGDQRQGTLLLCAGLYVLLGFCNKNFRIDEDYF